MSKQQAVLDWIDARFPLTSTWKAHVSEYYAPKNFNFWYHWFACPAGAGQPDRHRIFLTMDSSPARTEAFASVEYIMRDVEWGWLIRYMPPPARRCSSSSCTCMFRGLMYGSYQKPREPGVAAGHSHLVWC